MHEISLKWIIRKHTNTIKPRFWCRSQCSHTGDYRTYNDRGIREKYCSMTHKTSLMSALSVQRSYWRKRNDARPGTVMTFAATTTINDSRRHRVHSCFPRRRLLKTLRSSFADFMSWNCIKKKNSNKRRFWCASKRIDCYSNGCLRFVSILECVGVFCVILLALDTNITDNL